MKTCLYTTQLYIDDEVCMVDVHFTVERDPFDEKEIVIQEINLYPSQALEQRLAGQIVMDATIRRREARALEVEVA